MPSVSTLNNCLDSILKFPDNPSTFTIFIKTNIIFVFFFNLCRLLIQNCQKWQVAVAVVAAAMVVVKVDVGDTAVSKEGKITDRGHTKDLAQLVGVNQMDTTTVVDVCIHMKFREICNFNECLSQPTKFIDENKKQPLVNVFGMLTNSIFFGYIPATTEATGCPFNDYLCLTVSHTHTHTHHEVLANLETIFNVRVTV